MLRAFKIGNYMSGRAMKNWTRPILMKVITNLRLFLFYFLFSSVCVYVYIISPIIWIEIIQENCNLKSLTEF